MSIILSIYSKNSSSLTNFLKFLYKLKINKIWNLKFSISQCQQFRTRRIFSILKSPHVNKKSQEQFEFRIYKKQLQMHVSQLTTFLTILKIVKSNLFADISITIDFLVNPKSYKNRIVSKTNYDRFFKRFIRNNPKSYNPRYQVFNSMGRESGIKNKVVSKTNYGKIFKRFIKNKTKLKNVNIKFRSLISNKYLQILDIYGEVLLKIYV